MAIFDEPIPGTRAYYDNWQQQKAIREAARQTDEANRVAAGIWEVEHPPPAEINFDPNAGGPYAADPLAGMYEATPMPSGQDYQAAAQEQMDRQAAEAAAAEASRRGLSPYDVSAAIGGAAGQAGGNAYAMAQAAGSGRRVVTSTNPAAAPVRDFTAKTRATDAAGRQAEGQAMAVEDDYANRYRDFVTDEHARLSAAADIQASAELARAQQATDAMRRSRAIQMEVDKAADKFRKAPEEDQGRFWASRTGFQKVMLALSAVGKGWLQGQGYSVDPMEAIRDGIARDIEEQRSNRALLGEKLTARERQASEARQTYAQMLEQFGDQRLAENMIEGARLKEVQAKLAQMTASADVARLGPAHAKLAADLDAAVAKNELERRILEIKTPEKISRVVQSPTVTVIGPDGKPYEVPRSFALAQAGKEADMSRALRGKAADVSADASQKEADATAKIEAARAAGPSPAQQRVTQEQQNLIVKESKEAVNLKEAIGSFRKKWQAQPDVPGLTYGIGRHEVPFSDDDELVQADLGLIEDQLTTWMTGASSPPEMQKRYLDMLRNAKSEGELWGVLDLLESRADADIERVRRGVSKPERAKYEGISPDAAPDYDPEPSRTGEDDVIVWNK